MDVKVDGSPSPRPSRASIEQLGCAGYYLAAVSEGLVDEILKATLRPPGTKAAGFRTTNGTRVSAKQHRAIERQAAEDLKWYLQRFVGLFREAYQHTGPDLELWREVNACSIEVEGLESNTYLDLVVERAIDVYRPLRTNSPILELDDIPNIRLIDLEPRWHEIQQQLRDAPRIPERVRVIQTRVTAEKFKTLRWLSTRVTAALEVKVPREPREGLFTPSQMMEYHGIHPSRGPAFRRRLDRWKRSIKDDGSWDELHERKERYAFREKAVFHIVKAVLIQQDCVSETSVKKISDKNTSENVESIPLLARPDSPSARYLLVACGDAIPPSPPTLQNA